MKKNMINTTLGTWALLVVLFAAGCTPPPQNVNSNQNTNAAANTNSADIASIATIDSACSDTDIHMRRDKVFAKIKDKVEHSTSLSGQYAAQTFKFDVVIPPGLGVNTLNLLIEGKLSGPDGFGDLAKIIKNFVNAKCTSKVIFVPPGTLPLTASTASNYDGFEWIACDYPNVPCATGECLPPGTCPTIMPSGTPNANTGSNSNVNSTSNSNSRANANGK